MSTRTHPSDRLLDYLITKKPDQVDQLIDGPNTGPEDPPRWQPLFTQAGINLTHHLGEVKIHVLHYVWREWQKERRREILLKPDRLSGNKRRKSDRSGESQFGFSPRTYSSKVKELIEDGYLIEVGKDRNGSRYVRPAWSVQVSEDPVSILGKAHHRQTEREAIESWARKEPLKRRVTNKRGIGEGGRD